MSLRGNILAKYNTHKYFDNINVNRKKEKKEISLPLLNVTINELHIEVNECDYIRKMINKNHMGKVPSKAAKR